MKIRKELFLYFLIVFLSAIFAVGIFYSYREYQSYAARKAYEAEKTRIAKPGGLIEQIGRAYIGDILPPVTSHMFINIDSVYGRFNRPSIHYFRRQQSGVGVIEVVHDRLGLRVPRPGGAVEKVDILAVGGSQTWGQGLEYYETFAAVVADKFGLSLALAAVGGSSGLDSLGQILKNVSLKPKIILYGFFDDHRFRNFANRKRGNSADGTAPPHLKAHGSTGPFSIQVNPKPGQANPYQAWSEANLAKENLVGQDAVDPFFSGDYNGEHSYRPYHIDENLVPAAIGGMKFILTRMKEQADKLGARLIVLYFPTASIEVPPSTLVAPEQYARLAQELGFSFIDVTPEFIPYFENNRRLVFDIIIPKDGHYNVWANRIMAKKVIEEMKRLGF